MKKLQTWQEYLFKMMKDAGEEEKRIAVEKGNITSDGIPYITVIADGGWSKRSYGHGYNAASGVVSITLAYSFQFKSKFRNIIYRCVSVIY